MPRANVGERPTQHLGLSMPFGGNILGDTFPTTLPNALLGGTFPHTLDAGVLNDYSMDDLKNFWESVTVGPRPALWATINAHFPPNLVFDFPAPFGGPIVGAGGIRWNTPRLNDLTLQCEWTVTSPSTTACVVDLILRIGLLPHHAMALSQHIHATSAFGARRTQCRSSCATSFRAWVHCGMLATSRWTCETFLNQRRTLSGWTTLRTD